MTCVVGFVASLTGARFALSYLNGSILNRPGLSYTAVSIQAGAAKISRDLLGGRVVPLAWQPKKLVRLEAD